MNIYVIYKFSDAERVNALLSDAKSRDRDGLLHFFKFHPAVTNINWHKTAKKKCSNAISYVISAQLPTAMPLSSKIFPGS